MENTLSYDNFRNSRRLYGRDKEAEAIENVFMQTCSGQSGIIMVGGYAGTGKTSLINGVIKPLALSRGYFGSGKCDQFNSGAPYAPIIQAFEGVAAQILTESRDKFDIWKKKLNGALGSNGALITGVIPRFKLIIGPQPPMEILSPFEERNRFRLVFQKLASVFSSSEHPLVIFLDDLQWADPATLELIGYLNGDREQGYLLLAGAYRDNEITDSHPLTYFLSELRKSGADMLELSLEHLGIDDTCRYIVGMLGGIEQKVRPLAGQLYRITGGNPLFLGQIMKLLQDEGILKFYAAKGNWEWDMQSLLKLEIPEDVVSFMGVKLRRLPEECLGLVKMAACVGNAFDIETLSIACEKDASTIKSGLQPAIQAGLILPGTDTDPGREAYEFLHDRIYQATYSLLSEDQKEELHFKLGMLLMKNTPEGCLDNAMPLIMDHCNRGLDLVRDGAERIKFATYNLTAARKSKNVTDYHSARKFLTTGISLLPEDPWRDNYSLAFDLYHDCSLCEYLVGNIDEAERLSDLLLKYAKSNDELSEIYSLKMVMSVGVGKRAEAVPFGMKALELLGVNLPANPGNLILLKEILHAKLLLINRKTEDLFYLPDMKNPTQIFAMKLMSLLGSIAVSIRPNLYILLLLKGTVLAIRFGNSEMSAVAYAVYAVVLGEVLSDYKSALAFEKLSVRFAEKYDSSYAKCITYFVTGALVSHWTQPGRVGIDYLQKSIESGIQSGELLYTGYSIYFIIADQYLTGLPLADVDRLCRKWYGFTRQMKLEFTLAFIIILMRLVRALSGLSENDFQLRMAADSEKSVVEKITQNDIITASICHFLNMQRHYLFGEYEEALAMATKIEENLRAINGFMFSWSYRFYHSLTIAAIYENLPESGKRKQIGILGNNLRKIKKQSKICPQTFLHQYLLLNAETARLSGNNQAAMALYDQAVSSARDNGFIQAEAIASELAGRFYLSMGRSKIARVYLKDAARLFDKWGAAVKSLSLRQQFSSLFSETADEEVSGNDFKKAAVSLRLSDADKGASISEPESEVIQKVRLIMPIRL